MALPDWPLLEQIRRRAHGNGDESMTAATRGLAPRHEGASVARSVCPYCAVGCGQLIFHRGGNVVAVEGDPASPISAGRLCPKGAATQELLTHPARAKRVRYRAPFAASWTELDLDLSFAARERPALATVGSEAIDIETDRLARLAIGTRGAVEQQALSAIADGEAIFELVAT